MLRNDVIIPRLCSLSIHQGRSFRRDHLRVINALAFQNRLPVCFFRILAHHVFCFPALVKFAGNKSGHIPAWTFRKPLCAFLNKCQRFFIFPALRVLNVFQTGTQFRTFKTDLRPLIRIKTGQFEEINAGKFSKPV